MKKTIIVCVFSSLILTLTLLNGCNGGGGGGNGGVPPPLIFACNDNIDNDGDGQTDMNDPGCNDMTDQSEYGTNACDDGNDNDGDTVVDLNDPGCIDLTDSSESGSNACDDGMDNDNDGLTDTNDPGCDDLSDNDETRTIFANDDAIGAATGSSWIDALTVIQDAIDTALSGDQVWAAEGNYFRPIGANEPVLTMKEDVDIFGGFVGTENSLGDRTNPTSNPTTLNGENTSYHVVLGASNSNLDGFTITAGNASGGVGDDSGGGMYVLDVTGATITNCIFNSNAASANGGGLYIYNSAITMFSCTFSNNTAADGGGIYVDSNNSPYIINCIILGNTANNGAGIYNAQGSLISAINSTFSGNTATVSSGAFYHNGAATIINSILWGNSAPTGPEIALYFAGGYRTILDISYSDVEEDLAAVYIDDPMGMNCPILDMCLIWPTANMINALPQFAGYPDLHLTNISPCIDFGTSTGAPSTDYDGNPRPSPPGGDYDMGAYEYQQ